MSLSQAFRFGAVGLANTFTGLLVIYGLKIFANVGDVEANMAGYAVGMTVSFWLNRRWTFGHYGSRSKSAPKFLVTMAIGYLLNLLTVLVALRVFGVNSYVAQALGIAPFTITSFFLCKYWVFRASAA